MRSENAVYRPAWGYGMRVRLSKRGHPEDSHAATILWALPNPSKRPENQWYDVRFDSSASPICGRFHERYLERIEEGAESGSGAGVRLPQPDRL
jgi:hypothetical protein